MQVCAEGSTGGWCVTVTHILSLWLSRLRNCLQLCKVDKGNTSLTRPSILQRVIDYSERIRAGDESMV